MNFLYGTSYDKNIKVRQSFWGIAESFEGRSGNKKMVWVDLQAKCELSNRINGDPEGSSESFSYHIFFRREQTAHSKVIPTKLGSIRYLSDPIVKLVHKSVE